MYSLTTLVTVLRLPFFHHFRIPKETTNLCHVVGSFAGGGCLVSGWALETDADTSGQRVGAVAPVTAVSDALWRRLCVPNLPNKSDGVEVEGEGGYE